MVQKNTINIGDIAALDLSSKLIHHRLSTLNQLLITFTIPYSPALHFQDVARNQDRHGFRGKY